MSILRNELLMRALAAVAIAAAWIEPAAAQNAPTGFILKFLPQSLTPPDVKGACIYTAPSRNGPVSEFLTLPSDHGKIVSRPATLAECPSPPDPAAYCREHSDDTFCAKTEHMGPLDGAGPSKLLGALNAVRTQLACTSADPNCHLARIDNSLAEWDKAVNWITICLGIIGLISICGSILALLTNWKTIRAWYSGARPVSVDKDEKNTKGSGGSPADLNQPGHRDQPPSEEFDKKLKDLADGLERWMTDNLKGASTSQIVQALTIEVNGLLTQISDVLLAKLQDRAGGRGVHDLIASTSQTRLDDDAPPNVHPGIRDLRRAVAALCDVIIDVGKDLKRQDEVLRDLQGKLDQKSSEQPDRSGTDVSLALHVIQEIRQKLDVLDLIAEKVGIGSGASVAAHSAAKSEAVQADAQDATDTILENRSDASATAAEPVGDRESATAPSGSLQRQFWTDTDKPNADATATEPSGNSDTAGAGSFDAELQSLFTAIFGDQPSDFENYRRAVTQRLGRSDKDWGNKLGPVNFPLEFADLAAKQICVAVESLSLKRFGADIPPQLEAQLNAFVRKFRADAMVQLPRIGESRRNYVLARDQIDASGPTVARIEHPGLFVDGKLMLPAAVYDS